MQRAPGTTIRDRSIRFGRAVPWFVAAIAGVVLVGWALDVHVLIAPVRGTRAMMPTTAGMLISLACSLALLAPDTASRRRRSVGRAIAAITGAFVAGVFVDYLTATDVTRLPAPETLVALVLLALALVFLDRTGRRTLVPAEALALGALTIAVFVAIGHLYSSVYLEIESLLGMAVQTSVAIAALAIGVLAVRPDRGVAATVTGEHGGVLVRRVLVIAAIGLPAIGLGSVALQHAGAIPTPGAVVLGATLSLTLIVAAMLVSGARLDRMNVELRMWSAFVDAAPFGAVFATMDGALVRMNEAFAAMHGQSAGALVGTAVIDLFSPAARADVPQLFARSMELGRLRFESEHVRADGSVFPVAIDAAVLRDDAGRPIARIAYVQDITDEVRARADQARLANLVESSDDAIMATDLDGVVTAWNRGAERLYGYTAAEMIGHDGERLYPPARRAERAALVARILAGETIVGHETERVRKGGAVVPVSLTLSTIRGPSGTIGLAGIARDLTARLAAERAVVEAHDELARIERATATVSDAVAAPETFGLRGLLERIADQARALTGASVGAVGLAGPRPSACVATGDTSAAIRGVLAVPVTFRGETRAHLLVGGPSPDGFHDRDRRILAHLAANLGSGLEIAVLYEREAVERARLGAILAQIPEGVIVLDAAGDPIYENAAALAYRALPDASQLYDVRWPSGEPVPVPDLPLSRAFAGESTTGDELAVVLPDGESVPVLASASPIRVGGRPAGAVTVFRDIRALKELERRREEWSSVVAHELRQPINAIRLSVEIVARGGLSSEQIAWVQRLRGEIVRLDAMIADLLDASRLEARRMRLHRERVRPLALLEAAFTRAPDIAARCEVHVDRGLPPVDVDVSRMLQVLGNLLSNANKYGDAEAPIVVTATRDGEQVRFSVSNRGAGIQPEEIATLFDRFMRTRAARESQVEGLGLGLYICKGLVEAHRGRIWVESTPGDTTTFHVELPAVPTAADQLATPLAAEPAR